MYLPGTHSGRCLSQSRHPLYPAGQPGILGSCMVVLRASDLAAQQFQLTQPVRKLCWCTGGGSGREVGALSRQEEPRLDQLEEEKV